MKLTDRETLALKEAQGDHAAALREAGTAAMVLVESLRTSFKRHQELEQVETVKNKVIDQIAKKRGFTRAQITALDFDEVQFKGDANEPS